MFYRYHDSAIGRLFLSGDASGLQQLLMDVERHPWSIGEGWQLADKQFDDACLQLDEYFAGRRQRFDLRLAPQGTVFQQRVWKALQDIPYGQTSYYSRLAEQIGNPKAVRAVGTANGANPISVIIPCHRVIGRDGSLTGYAGGLQRKAQLLALEGASFPEQTLLSL
ncbi:methylated-DNA--[protein]-cysteine S-methyltransferase [Pseudomonas sp. RL_15y_Pfl2_60]|uniref:methylated-DNA--[protein]-cysteine S-methyltransferase n=1 Tax=Pseudomonas sp. RL_15y_Pfl2_60 TaxID=3088709 RepID=UPI0030D864C9